MLFIGYTGLVFSADDDLRSHDLLMIDVSERVACTIDSLYIHYPFKTIHWQYQDNINEQAIFVVSSINKKILCQPLSDPIQNNELNIGLYNIEVSYLQSDRKGFWGNIFFIRRASFNCIFTRVSPEKKTFKVICEKQYSIQDTVRWQDHENIEKESNYFHIYDLPGYAKSSDLVRGLAVAGFFSSLAAAFYLIRSR